jgi:tetratricopeptide (TPR) repeat protein
MRVSSRLKLLVAACFTAASAQSANWGQEYILAIAAYERGDYATAEEHDRAALAVAESFEKNDLRLEATLTNLGAVVQARKGCCEAEPLLRRALEIRVSNFGRNSVEAAQGQNNLASAFFQAGRIEEARKLQAEALGIAERILGPNEPDLVPFLALAALTERDSLHYVDAEDLLKRALPLAEKDAAENPRRLMQVWGYLGSVYRAAGRLDNAEKAYRKLASLAETRLGADTLDTANALANLGAVLCDRKFYADSRPHLVHALDIFQRIHEMNGPNFVATLQNLASAELYLGEANAAEQHALLAIRELEKRPALDREALALSHNNLGQVYAAEGRYTEAEQETVQAKDMWSAISGPESKNVAAAISNLGALYVQERKYKKAEALYLESAQIACKISGSASKEYARELNRLGVLYNAEKRFTEAEEALRNAVEIDSRTLGDKSPILAESYLNLAASLHSQKRRDEALECFRRGIEIMTNAGQKEAPTMAAVLDQYSVLLREMNRWADAEKASTEALGIRVREKVNGETYR